MVQLTWKFLIRRPILRFPVSNSAWNYQHDVSDQYNTNGPNIYIHREHQKRMEKVYLYLHINWYNFQSINNNKMQQVPFTGNFCCFSLFQQCDPFKPESKRLHFILWRRTLFVESIKKKYTQVFLFISGINQINDFRKESAPYATHNRREKEGPIRLQHKTRRKKIRDYFFPFKVKLVTLIILLFNKRFAWLQTESKTTSQQATNSKQNF
jgi:hypothetical protein